MATLLRSPDLERGDIILTSMALRFGQVSDAGFLLPLPGKTDFAFGRAAVEFLAPAVENSAINLATLSVYSHAMLYVGASSIVEFRNDLSQKTLRSGLTEGGKNRPAVAHVFRHKQSNEPRRERILAEAKKNMKIFKSVDMSYVMDVWLNLNSFGSDARKDQVKGMVVCTTFVTTTYANAGLPLNDGNPHNMTAADIARCSDPATRKDVGNFTRLVESGMTAIANPNFKPTLDLIGAISPTEYQ